MTRRNSLVWSKSILIDSALLTAGVIHEKEGFRAPDLEFLFCLFGNWLEYDKRDPNFKIALMQIHRFLTAQRGERNVEVIKRFGKSKFRLTSRGAMFLLKRIASPADVLPFDEVVLVQYILKTYGRFIKDFLLKPDDFATKEFEQEVLKLVTPGSIVKEQKIRVSFLIKDFQTRMEESHHMVEFSRRSLEEGHEVGATVKKMGQHFRYQLSMRKSLQDLFNQLPDKLREHELTHGIQLRNETLFHPLLNHYLDLEKKLERLL